LPKNLNDRFREKENLMPMIVVPASMREDPTGNDQPLDRAWTIRTNGMRVPASMREEVNGIVQPLDSAGSTIKSDAIEVVPAPRLELGTGSDNICALRCVLSAALEELERGQTRHAKAILNTLKEVLS
tara:strand:+ start:2649 stop:3032 length:384 start_codon:yes stop_codon:yes gene_type:complete